MAIMLRSLLRLFLSILILSYITGTNFSSLQDLKLPCFLSWILNFLLILNFWVLIFSTGWSWILKSFLHFSVFFRGFFNNHNTIQQVYPPSMARDSTKRREAYLSSRWLQALAQQGLLPQPPTSLVRPLLGSSRLHIRRLWPWSLCYRRLWWCPLLQRSRRRSSSYISRNNPGKWPRFLRCEPRRWLQSCNFHNPISRIR